VKPLPLRQTDADEYMLALKQELRGCMRELPYFIKNSVETKGEYGNWLFVAQGTQAQKKYQGSE